MTERPARGVSADLEPVEQAAALRHLVALAAEVSLAVNQEGTVRSMVQRCAEALVRHLGVAFARVWTLEAGRDVLELQASAGLYTHLDGAHSRIPLGRYKIGLIAREARPHVTNRVIGDPRVHDQDWAKREGMTAFAGYPLTAGGRTVGVMGMFAREPLAEDTLDLLASVAAAIAQAIARTRAEEALRESRSGLQRESERLLALHRASTVLASQTAEPDTVLDEVLRSAVALLGAGSASLYLWDEPAQLLRCTRNWQVPAIDTTPDVRVGEGLAGQTFARAEPLIVNDYMAWELAMPSGRDCGLSAGLGVPLRRAGEPIGVLLIRSYAADAPPFTDDDARVVALFGDQAAIAIANARQVAERRLLEAELRHSAFHDPLTGLPNRTLFADRLAQLLSRARRRKQHRLALLLLDLDRFKDVNDSLGHLAGDRLLIGVARGLERVVRDGDSVARLGGDEFAILLDDIKDPGDAMRVANRIQRQLALPVDLDERHVSTTASIGIAFSTPNRADPDELLRDADTALYRAKALGKGRCTVFDTAMRAQTVARLELEADLRHAAERGELRLHYQPIMSLRTGELTRVEALLRWQHPRRRLLRPAEFLPMAEETGLIVPIGRWVLRAACAQVKGWHDAGLSGVPVAVNVSAHQLGRGDLGEVVSRTLDETGLPAACLELELTESAVMEHVGRAIGTLQGLKALGVRIAVDDFGTGYSSLSYLTRLPIDALKIDRSFVRDLMTDRTSEMVTKAVVDLAHNLGLTVTAEGADTPGHVAYLRSLGCDEVQGYLIGRPTRADNVLPLLRRGGRLWPHTTVATLVGSPSDKVTAKAQRR